MRHSLVFEKSTFTVQDGLGSVLEVSWAPFGSSWGSLGRPLEALVCLFGDLWGLRWSPLVAVGLYQPPLASGGRVACHVFLNRV